MWESWGTNASHGHTVPARTTSNDWLPRVLLRGVVLSSTVSLRCNLSCMWLRPMSVYCGNRQCISNSSLRFASSEFLVHVPFFVASVCLGCKFDYRVQWHFDIWKISLRKVMEVGVTLPRQFHTAGMVDIHSQTSYDRLDKVSK